MKKISFCLSLCIIILSFTSNAFAKNISDSFENTNDNVIINDIVVGEPEISEELLDLNPKCEIVSGSAIKLSNDEYDNLDYTLNTRASQPDLLVTGLASSGTYPFEALSDSTIQIKISNRGNATANNFNFGVYVDDNYIGSGAVNSLGAGYVYTVDITLSNIREGTHTVKVIADKDNNVSESNESNNTMTKDFIWKGTPDLAAEIEGGPADNSDVDGESSFQFKLYIRNIGNGDASKIPVAISVGDSILTTSMDGTLLAKTKTHLPVTITFYGYGKNNLEFNVNRDKTIVESNYKNNTAIKTYNIVYCTHFWDVNKFSVSTAKNIKIQVQSSATDVFDKSIFNRGLDWNNITDNVKISSPEFNDNSTDAKIIVKGEKLADVNTLGKTSGATSANGRREIKLNISENSLKDQNDEGKIKTYIHEVGHALGLDHPEGTDEEPTDCEYSAVMRQTRNSLSSDELTSHDRYNLLKLYE